MILRHLDRSQSDLLIALKGFQDSLTSEQVTQLTAFSSALPGVEDVLHLTKKINEQNSHRKSRVFVTRIQGLLDFTQQYCSIIDTCAGSNQISALVWGTIKLFVLVND